MSNLRQRLARMEREQEAHERSSGQRDSGSDRARRALAGHRLCQYPDIAEVKEGDTDPATFAEIQELLAWSKGNGPEAEYWQREADKHRPAKPSSVSLKCLFEMYRDSTTDYGQWHQSQEERFERAIERAKRSAN